MSEPGSTPAVGPDPAEASITRADPADTLLGALSGLVRVLLTGPVAPDGDSIGACLALQRMLAHRGIQAAVAGEASYRYAWMPGAGGMIADERLTGAWDAVVVLDGDRHRLTPQAERAFHGAAVRGIVDHHASTRPDGYTVTWIEPDATSTCTMLYGAAERWGVPLDRELATLLYTGVVFDSGGFRYSNTGPATHEMAARLLEAGVEHVDVCARILAERRRSGLRLAGHVFTLARFELDGQLAIGEATLELAGRCGIVEGDLEGVVEALLHVVGVEVAILLVERTDGTVKYSLRSRGRVNVAHVAAELAPSGGGHAKAAGASVRASVPDAAARVQDVVARALRDGP